MDNKTANKLVEKIDGWKTVIGAIGTPVASLILAVTPQHTAANKIAFGFTLLFGGTGLTGVFHKWRKKELPNQVKKELPGGLAEK